MRKLLASVALRWQLSRFLRHANPFHQMLGQAIRLQLRQISDDEFRQHLEQYYATLDRDALRKDIDFPAKASRLNQPGGYKVGVVGLREDAERPGPRRPWHLWARRFALLQHLGVRSDVLILREGEQIPPHGHSRVVSGFYVLEGEVAVRHFDRVRDLGDKVLVRKVFDAVVQPGGYTTNSEHHNNIHWLAGMVPVSYLFRITVLGTPTLPFRSGGQSDRLYVDPSGEADNDGLIAAPYITEEQAKNIPFGGFVPKTPKMASPETWAAPHLRQAATSRGFVGKPPSGQLG
jgi:hypothetical protein